MTAAIRTATGRPGAWLMHEPPQRHGRERVVVAQGGVIRDGAVVGRVLLGEATAEPDETNSPMTDLTITPGPLGPNTRPGAYRIAVAVPGSDLVVTDPLGAPVGFVPAAFVTSGHTFTSNSISFTVAGTAYTSGDAWSVVVEPGTGEAVPLGAPDAPDGSGRFAGIMVGDADAREAAQRAMVLAYGPAVVSRSGLRWPEAYATEAARAAIYGQMAARGIKVAQTA